MKRIAAVGLAAATILTVAACGGSAKHPFPVATCLRNALYAQTIHAHLGCHNDALAKAAAGGSGTRISVTCTRRNGHNYICHVHVPADNLSGVRGGFYNVVSGATSITYQPTDNIGS